VGADSAASRPGHEAFIRIEPRLLEEATFLALRGHPELRRFDLERTRLYAIEDADDRERRFRALHAAWFRRLDLGRPLGQALDEQPSIRAGAQSCLLVRAAAQHDEGADLHVDPLERDARAGAAGRTLLGRPRPEAFCFPERLLVFLRHELQHVADMLDAGFGYEPTLPAAGPDPAQQRLLLGRYAVLWDITVDGRLERRGQAAQGVKAIRRREFERAFPTLGERGTPLFERLYSGEPPPHADLLAIARDPLAALRALLREAPSASTPELAQSSDAGRSSLGSGILTPGQVGSGKRR
jgi:hypothetical protein